MRPSTLSFVGRNFNKQQNTLLRTYPCAGFAKYTRDKPHLNVGTIGKLSCSLLAATLSFSLALKTRWSKNQSDATLSTDLRPNF